MRTIFAIALVLFTASCSGSYEQLEELDWMLGKWESKANGKNMLEVWNRENDSTLIGRSMYLEGKDTLLQEEMTIAVRQDSLYFKTVITREDSLTETARFNMLKLEDEKIVFENLLHDFPQRIVYAAEKPNKLIAYIDGNLNGQYNRINFIMKRKK